MIYILGNSHSGSTLLSFLLSFHPDIINLGELKSKTWLKTRLCSCGQPISTCKFYEHYFQEFNALKEPAMKKIRATNPLLFLFRKKIKPDETSASGLHLFYESVSRRVAEMYPNADFFVDSSKSIWLLNAWMHTLPSPDIKIIWIRRQVKANVASFVKRGTPFYSALLTVVVNNWITGIFLRRNHLDYLEVNYDRFYDAYADEAKLISAFLGLDVPPINSGHKNHHVISGNAKTKQAFTNHFTGFHKDDEWQRILSEPQKKILSWIS